MSGAQVGVPPEAGHPRLNLVAGALALASLLAAMDMMVVNVAMYSIIKELDPLHGVDDSRWVLTVYTLALGVTTPLYGKLADRLGGKRIMLVALAIFVGGSLLCGMATSMPALIAFRGVQGLGAGGLMSVAMVIIGQLAPPRDRAKYGGYIGGVTLIGIIAGPVVGGFFADTHVVLGMTVTWRGAFLINVPLTLIVAAAVALAPKAPVGKRGGRVDFAGAVAMVLAVGAVLLTTEHDLLPYAWASPWILGATGAVLLLIFFLLERRASDPILPLSLFRNSTFRVTVILAVLTGFALLGMAFYMALYMRIVRGLGALDTCVHLMPMIIGMLLGLLLSGSLISKFNRYRPFPIVGSVAAAASVALCATLDATTSFWLVSLYLAVFGLGIGQLNQVPTAAVQNTVDFSDVGTASTATAFMRMIGQSLGPAVFGALLASRFLAEVPAALAGRTASENGSISVAGMQQLPTEQQHQVLDAFLSGLHAVFLLGAATLALAFLVSLFFKEPTVPEPAKTEPATAPATAI
ncbi:MULTISPECIES: MFS transporter [Amycolatopsis]|uniref:MFS transporter n=1 Tax=Amycolatopsis albidoflavus TaxID=102226 RepID=A0ABW5I8W4_9PSEU